jgi:hypothetical protein
MGNKNARAYFEENAEEILSHKQRRGSFICRAGKVEKN